MRKFFLGVRPNRVTLSSVDADVIIAGAGCAGLSLAVRMRARRPGARILLLDRDHGGHPHKLWSFWSERPHAVLPFEMPFASWRRLHAAGPGWSRTQSLGALTYCTVHSDRFESRARDILEAYPDVELRTGQVEDVTSSFREARVHLRDGSVLRARHVFQSCVVPRQLEPRYPLWQHFAGVVVRSDEARFDPTTFTLMDFDVPQREGPTFMYRLPFSAHEQLHEHTVFSSVPLSRAEHRAALRDELERRGLGGLEVVREEYGAIPMFERRPAQRRGPRTFNLGVVGGMAKPTTGYAFARIQQQTEHLARTWAAGRPSPLPDPAWRLRAYDTTLLDLIARSPQQATRAFQQLLARAEAESVLRFLDERPTLRDELSIMFGTLAWGPFLRSAIPALRHTPWRVASRPVLPPVKVPALPEAAR